MILFTVIASIATLILYRTNTVYSWEMYAVFASQYGSTQQTTVSKTVGENSDKNNSEEHPITTKRARTSTLGSLNVYSKTLLLDTQYHQKPQIDLRETLLVDHCVCPTENTGYVLRQSAIGKIPQAVVPRLSYWGKIAYPTLQNVLIPLGNRITRYISIQYRYLTIDRYLTIGYTLSRLTI